MEATGLDADIGDGCGAARGILFGLLLCVPFWVGVYLMLFSLWVDEVKRRDQVCRRNDGYRQRLRTCRTGWMFAYEVTPG